MKKIILAVVIFVFAASIFLFRVQLKDFVGIFLKPDLPEPKQAQEFTIGTSGASIEKEQNTVLPDSVNLEVPFATQAPFVNWDMPYQEACEEAAAIMVHRYFTGEELTPEIMDKELLSLIEWEKQTFGYYQDTTGEETAGILREYFGHKKVTVKYGFNMDDVRTEVAAGKPVILLAAGKLLGNPNFKNGGPVYHALVVKGYTEGKIITNDPGTRNGHDYLYDPDVLMNAAHEWDKENILKGRKVMVFVEE